MKQEGNQYRATTDEWMRLVKNPDFDKARGSQILTIGDVERDKANPITLVPLNTDSRKLLVGICQTLTPSIVINRIPRQQTPQQ